MNNILCSILIPVYNAEAFIEKTIKSCLAQSLIDRIEIILIDDCSKDNSFEIIKNSLLSISNKKITFLKNDTNLGINKTINKAASLAKGKYFLFLGHDDMIRPSHIEIMINEFENDTAFVHCNSELIDKDDNVIGTGVDNNTQIKKTKRIKYYLSISNVVHSTGTLISKRHFDLTGGWDEKYKNYGEWLMWIKLSSIGEVKYSSKTQALYRKHDTNITNSFNEEKIKPELQKYFKLCQSTALSKINNNQLRIIIKLAIIMKPIIRNYLLNREHKHV